MSTCNSVGLGSQPVMPAAKGGGSVAFRVTAHCSSAMAASEGSVVTKSNPLIRDILCRFENKRSIHHRAMAQDGFKLSKGSSSNVTTGAFFAARDEYRKHPILNNHMKRSMPGFGIALAAFGVYLFVDGMSSRMSSTKKESH